MSDYALEELASELDNDFADWRNSLSHLELAELRLYQGTGYLRINPLLREEVSPGDYDEDTLARLERTIETLDGAIENGALRSDLTVYRGLREPEAVFEVPDITLLVAETANEPAYSSTSLDPDIALRMTATAHSRVLVQLRLEAGQPAAWLGSAGSPQRRREYELLLPRRLQIRIQEVDTSASVPSIQGSVVA